MGSSGFFAPLLEAFSLIRRWAAIGVFGLLVAGAVLSRPMMVGFASGQDRGNVVAIVVAGLVMSLLLTAVSQFLIGRNLLALQAALPRPLWARWIGLIVLAFFAKAVLGQTFNVMLFAISTSEVALTYGSVSTGSLAAIVIFPLTVRALLAVAGVAIPRLGEVVNASLNKVRTAYFWYALTALTFPLLMVFAFVSLSEEVGDANAPVGNLVQSAISTFGSVLEILLALVAARSLADLPRDKAETFA